jgi:hypothetical protein
MTGQQDRDQGQQMWSATHRQADFDHALKDFAEGPDGDVGVARC